VSQLVDDFVPLTDRCAVSPALQVSVRLGRFDLEMNGVQMVKVYHDPLLSSDRLFMPEAESPYYIEPSVPLPEPHLIPFFSKLRTTLFEFGFSPRDDREGSLIYSATAYDRVMADLMARHLSKKLDGEAQSRPYELLHLILGAIGRLRDWPLVVGFKGEWDRIEIRIGSSFVAAIRDATGVSFPIETADECLLATIELPRQLAPQS
jgi:hypothetical protein